MAASERSPALLQVLDVPEPAAVTPPLVLQSHHRSQRGLQGGVLLRLALDLEAVNHEPVGVEHGTSPRLIVGEARASPCLAPLLVLERHAADGATGCQHPASPLDDR